MRYRFLTLMMINFIFLHLFFDYILTTEECLDEKTPRASLVFLIAYPFAVRWFMNVTVTVSIR